PLYELSPSSVGNAALSTPPPSIFPHTWVRASSAFRRTFTLDMDRSPRFGSTTTYSPPYSDSLSLRLHLFSLTLHGIITRRSILQKVRHHLLTDSDYL